MVIIVSWAIIAIILIGVGYALGRLEGRAIGRAEGIKGAMGRLRGEPWPF